MNYVYFLHVTVDMQSTLYILSMHFLGHFYEFHNFMIQIHEEKRKGECMWYGIINSQTDIQSAEKSRSLVSIHKN